MGVRSLESVGAGGGWVHLQHVDGKALEAEGSSW